MLEMFGFDFGVHGNLQILSNANEIIQKIQEECIEDSESDEAFRVLLKDWGFEKICEVLTALVQRRYEFSSFLKNWSQKGGEYEDFLREILHEKDVSGDENAEAQNDSFNETAVRQIAASLLEELANFPGGEAAQKPSDVLFLDNLAIGRFHDAFITTTSTLRKRLLTAKTTSLFPDASRFLQRQSEAFFKKIVDEKTYELIQKTQTIIELGTDILRKYQDYKEANGVHDFEDLITLCGELLQSAKGNERLLIAIYKQFPIKHVFLDEAQDTSPQQWQVVLLLVEVFLRDSRALFPEASAVVGGGGAAALPPSLFVVGDVKQSIYSFQGACPRLFCSLEPLFRGIIEEVGGEWHSISLTKSYRTAAEILEVVDRIFEDDPAGLVFDSTSSEVTYQQTFCGCGYIPSHQKNCEQETRSTGEELYSTYCSSRATSGSRQSRRLCWGAVRRTRDLLGAGYSRHTAWRTSKGFVWTVNIDDDDNMFDDENQNSASETSEKNLLVAKKTAQAILSLLRSKIFLPSMNRAIVPNDILVLTRKRTAVVKLLSDELASYGIPTESDKLLKVDQQLIWLDLLAFVRFLNFPYDDYTLACLIKSPFFDIDINREELLFEICAARTAPLFFSQFIIQSVLYEHYIAIWQSEGAAEISDCFYRLLASVRANFRKEFGIITEAVFELFFGAINDFLQRNSPDLRGLLDFLEKFGATATLPKVGLHGSHSESDESGAARVGVRFTTVHASKGLQSPVVFILDQPDRNVLQKENFIWFPLDEGTEKQQIFCASGILLMPTEAFASKKVLLMREQVKCELMEENQRLLYVALTRAQDILVSVGKSKDGWHKKVCAHTTSQLADLPFHCSPCESNVEPCADAEEPLSLNTFVDNTSEEQEIHTNRCEQTPKHAPLPRRAFSSQKSDSKDLERGRIVHHILNLLCESDLDLAGLTEHRYNEFVKGCVRALSATYKNCLPEDVLTFFNFEKFLTLSKLSEFRLLKEGRHEVSICDHGKIYRVDYLHMSNDGIVVVEVKTLNTINNIEYAKPAYLAQIQKYYDLFKTFSSREFAEPAPKQSLQLCLKRAPARFEQAAQHLCDTPPAHNSLCDRAYILWITTESIFFEDVTKNPLT
jgi:ATP-dependent exoDNAse (exonuclease V) beta subunit